MGGTRQVQAPPGAGHGDVQETPFFGDHVLAAAHQRFEHRRWKLETRRPSGLRQPSLDQRWHEHHFKLEAFRLMDGHDLDGVRCLDRRRLRIFSGQQDEVEVSHVRDQRVVR